MNRARFLTKILSLALAVALVVGMVPGISAKAAGTGWIEVTSENRALMEENLIDISDLVDGDLAQYIKEFKIGHTMSSINTDDYFIIGKKGTDYVCLYKYWDSVVQSKLIGSDEIGSDGKTYYFYPKYTVTFDPAGGNMESTTATTAGGILTGMPTPTKEGYAFTGWYTTPEGTDYVEQHKVYNAPTTLYAHWYKWTGKEGWVRATTLSNVENADLPILGSSASDLFANECYKKIPFPSDEWLVVIGKFYSQGEVLYWTTSADNMVSSSGKLYTGYYPSNDTLVEMMQSRTFYVLADPNAVKPDPINPNPDSNPEPSNPEPSNPEPSNPEPSNPEPSNPEPSNPKPSNPKPSNPEPSNPEPAKPTTSAPATPAPVLKTTNVAGEQISGWDAIAKAISTQTKDEQESVSGSNQDILHVDASSTDKIIPAATVKEISSSALRGLHVFIGDSDAVTFLAKNDFSGYKETNFEHKDTITEHSRTIDFTNKQDLGATVVFHTTVPVSLGEVTIYKVDADNNKTLIGKVISNANGQVCFEITETATYVLEY